MIFTHLLIPSVLLWILCTPYNLQVGAHLPPVYTTTTSSIHTHTHTLTLQYNSPPSSCVYFPTTQHPYLDEYFSTIHRRRSLCTSRLINRCCFDYTTLLIPPSLPVVRQTHQSPTSLYHTLYPPITPSCSSNLPVSIPLYFIFFYAFLYICKFSA